MINIYLASSFCEDSAVLRSFYFMKVLFLIVSIIIPLYIIVRASIDLSKTVFDGNRDTILSVSKTIMNRVVAAMLIFFVPSIINIIFSFVGSNADLTECYNNANLEYIALKEKEEAAELILKEEQRLQQLTELAAQEKKTQTLTTAANETESVNLTEVKVTSSELEVINFWNNNISIMNYNCTGKFGATYINKSIKNEFVDFLGNVQDYVNRTNGIPCLQTIGVYTEDEGSKHNQGLAIDLFNQWEYYSPTTKTTYKPYTYQGENTWNDYRKFVCEVCNGIEDCPTNINYQIAKKYFTGTGRCWGGTWSTGYFDPMHFEFGSTCTFPPNRTIDCTGFTVGGNNTQTTFVSGMHDGTYNNASYVEIIPEDATEDMPLLVFLHGGAEQSGLSALKQTAIIDYINTGSAYAAVGKFIFVAPYSSTAIYQDTPLSQAWNIISYIADKYKVNKNRIYLTGMSNGGEAVWKLSSEHTNYFAAIAPMSGFKEGINPSIYVNVPVYAIRASNDNFDYRDANGNTKYDNGTLLCNYISQINTIKRNAGNNAKGTATCYTAPSTTHNTVSGVYKSNLVFENLFKYTK